MSREVSVDDQIRFITGIWLGTNDEDWGAKYEAVLATLRRSVLLERVVEAASEVVPLIVLQKRVGGELLNRLGDALSALRDHDKLGKEG